jgi:hypothetical protein
MPDGYTYENTVGGWSMCDICGVRVTDKEKHTAWHLALMGAIVNASRGINAFFEWNFPPKDPADG